MMIRIKIKRTSPFFIFIIYIGYASNLSRRNLESSEKRLYALLITHLPTAGRDFKK